MTTPKTEKPQENYVRQAKPDPQSRYDLGVYDGDTIDLIVDVGYRFTTRQRIRLLGVNTPELQKEQRPQGLHFKALTHNWIKQAIENNPNEEYPLTIQTHKSDSFGRYLAEIWKPNENQSLTQYLLENGAPPWKKKK